MHEPGSVSGLVIFQEMQWFHRRTQRKKSDEMGMADSGPLAERHPNQWAVLADKGCQGAGEFCRINHPTRKPQGSFLSPVDVSTNKFIFSDCILVENYFGRLCGLWNVLRSKWKWSEINYDTYFVYA